MKNLKTIFIALIAITMITSCELDPEVLQEKTVEGSIQTTGDVQAIILGAYNRMTGSNYYGRNVIIFGEVRTDNTFPNGSSGRFVQEGSFKLLATYGNQRGAWADMYRVIASANIVIGVNGENLQGEIVEFNHYKGEALTMRALAHFDALRLYGQMNISNGTDLGIPYITEFKGDNLYPFRLSIDEVKDMIIQDLLAAKPLMDPAYDNALKQQFGSASPDALLSRVYLYFGMWTEARDAAQKVMSDGRYSIMSRSGYLSSFGTDGSTNTIMALANSETDNAGINSLGYIYLPTNYGDVEVLQNALDIFEPGDIRGLGGIIDIDPEGRIRNVGKYPSDLGYADVNLIRYEEIVLNHAEALWRLNSSDPNVLVDLNSIATNRGATALTSVDLDVILNERRKELMFEGFRYDDLMRNGLPITKVDPKQLFPAPGIPYGDDRLAFPIPEDEMNANSNMSQNPSY
jgi:hypothetical protein